MRPKVVSNLPTKYGDFKIYIFKEKKKYENVVLVKGDIKNKTNILLRIHSECLTGDIFGCQRCDCQDQLEYSLSKIGKEGGIILYLRQEGRGIGLINKLKAYNLQDNGLDTVEANIKLGFKPDYRNYEYASNILKYFSIKSVNLLSNNINKYNSLIENNISVTKRIPIVLNPNIKNRKDLFLTKVKKLNHDINLHDLKHD